MKPILIVRHVAHEGPGYLADYLEKRSVPFRVLAIDRGDEIPDTVEDLAAIVFMGGPMSVNDDLPWIPPVLGLIRKALAAGLPLLGHCLGGQLIAKALGAKVGPNPVEEYGWLPVQVTDNDVANRWFEGVDPEFIAFHWHGETFDVPEGGTHVLASTHCRNQGFVIGNSLALQCHIEMTPELVNDWVSRADDVTLSPSPSIQGRDEILADLDQKVGAMQTIADKIYDRWLEGIKL